MSSYITTFVKLGVKSIIDDISRALNKPLDEVADIKRGYAELEREMKQLDKKLDDSVIEKDEYDIAKEDIDNRIEEYLSRYEDIFYYYKGLKGTISAVGYHPAGMIGSPVNIKSEIGLRYNKSNDGWISSLDMKQVDGLNYVKYDILSLKTLQVLKHTYGLIGKSFPRSHEMDWCDEKVFESINDSPIGLFQFEKENAWNSLKGFKCSSVKDIALITAVIRPSCASFRDKVINREDNINPDTRIDELLSDSYGYLVYQEQQISFLQKLCGFSEGQADVVRRAIGKKDPVLLAEWLPKIEDGFISNSLKDEEEAKIDCEQFMQVFMDAVNYSFSYNHAIAYSMITYMTAYVRLYYPKEFIASYLNNATDDDDVINGAKLAKVYGIEVKNPKFGKSLGGYTIDGDDIYRGIGSVLHLSNNAAIDLKDIFDTNTRDNRESFLDVVSEALERRSINRRMISILIKIDFFSDYGKDKKLSRFFYAFCKYHKKKQLSKDKIASGLKKIIEYHLKKGSDGFKETSKLYKFNDMMLLKEIFKAIKSSEYSYKEKAINQLSYLSYLTEEVSANISVGVVAYNKSKKDSFFIKFMDGNSGWYMVSDKLEDLHKDQMIFVNRISNRISGRKTEKYIESYETVELDRIKK